MPSPSSTRQRDHARRERARTRPRHRGRRGRPRCTGGPRPGRTRHDRRTWRPARPAGSRGSSARPPARRRRRWPRPGRAGRCPGRPCTPAPSATSIATARRAGADAGIDDREHDALGRRTGSPGRGRGRRRARRTARMPCVRSTTVTWGARSRMTALDDADELVVEAVVGEERHRVVAPSHRAWTLTPAVPTFCRSESTGSGRSRTTERGWARTRRGPVPTPRWHQPRRRGQDFRPSASQRVSDSTRATGVRKESRPKNSGVIHHRVSGPLTFSSSVSFSCRSSALRAATAQRPRRTPLCTPQVFEHLTEPSFRRTYGDVTISRNAAASPRSASSAEEPTDTAS